MVEISFLKLLFANHPKSYCILCFSSFAVVGFFFFKSRKNQPSFVLGTSLAFLAEGIVLKLLPLYKRHVKNQEQIRSYGSTFSLNIALYLDVEGSQQEHWEGVSFEESTALA